MSIIPFRGLNSPNKTAVFRWIVVCRSPLMTDEKSSMAEHYALETSASPVSSASTPPRFPPEYLAGEEELDETLVAVVIWNTEAINRFLEKWDNAIFETPPPF